MTTPDQTTAPQSGLKRQIVVRFVVVFACAALLGSLGALFGYRMLSGQSNRHSADETATHIARHFKQIKQTWESDAIKLKAQIDFMRLLEGNDPNRWLKMHAYLTVQQGEIMDFDTMLILRKNGSVAFSNGPDVKEMVREDASRFSGKWYLSEDHDLHMAIRLPIWLGDEGKGTLLLLRPVDNATLISLAPPNVDLSLMEGNSVIASSLGSSGIGQQINPDFSGTTHPDGVLVEQRLITLDDDSGVPARLVMRQRFTEALTSPGLIFSAILLLALLSLMLWIVLGRWLQHITRRIRRLSQATHIFSEKHTVNNAVTQCLDYSLTGADEISEVSASCRDMMHSVERHQEEHLAYMQTLDMLEEGVVEIDRDGHFLRASAGWHKLAKCDECSPHHSCTALYQCIHEEDEQVLANQLAVLFSGEKSQITGRTRLSRSGGTDEWVEYRFVAGATGPDGIHSARGVMRDITQSYQLEKRVTHMALHDALTGLPNRVLLEDRCELSLSMADRTNHKVAIGFIDLDHFKNINDTFGHKTGDRLLLAFANTLKQALRSGDTLARWGGDEFIVLLPDLPDVENVRQAAQKLVDTCSQQILLDDNEFNVTFSIGISLYPDDTDNVETLLAQADRAMFHAKEQGRNNVQFFCDMTSKGLGKKDVYIQNRLSSAIKNHQIKTWFQPLVDAESHCVMGVEALARWHDDEYGWISPATFIPMAENLGMIRELGEQVWLETLRNGKRWREMGIDLRLAVNVSRRQLFLPSFTLSLLENLREFDIPPSAIILEITESVALTDTEFTSKRLQELTDAGFTLAIDDFGTGYSSLSQLHNMPVGKLKIDISFVRRVHEPQGAELVQAIVHMAEAFDLRIVAEGVEDEKTALILREYGVHFLQGYFFGKPMPPDEMDVYLVPPVTP